MTFDNTFLSYQVGTQAYWDNASEILITGSIGEIPFSDSRALLTSMESGKTETALAKADLKIGG